MATWKWYVYIVECQDGLYYTGMTWNVDLRMQQHQSGFGSKFTTRHGYKQVRYIEEFNDIHEARRREHQLKDFSRKKKELLFEQSENYISQPRRFAPRTITRETPRMTGWEL